jgi:hypothetical protein
LLSFSNSFADVFLADRHRLRISHCIDHFGRVVSRIETACSNVYQLPLGLPEYDARFGGDRFCQRRNFCCKLISRNNPTNESTTQSVSSVESPTGQNQVVCQ